jgi:uncharacterized protein YbjT (DUF2867 family)
MTDTVLVLGATGKTGRRLVPKLAQHGASVRAASRQPGEGRTLFDWNRPDIHKAALAGVDAVYLVPPELPSRRRRPRHWWWIPAPGADRQRQAALAAAVLSLATSAAGTTSPWFGHDSEAALVMAGAGRT